ncbi:MAG TPA: CusA/CzcA family heavy metal efflux RND transporter [bacterium]|nr:CusA/CzcA family heavy metal efflux RND transporter [bacterium]
MIAKIIEWCAKNKFLVSLGTVFAVAWGAWALRTIPLDAIPDISDTQVVLYAKWMKSPDILEDQVAYPLVRSLLGAPKVKAIRAFSDFGYAYVYIIFEDGTDVYWARSRVQEYLSKAQGMLPQGVSVEMGPDATGVGWVYQYALVDKSGKHDLADLKGYQDWNLRYQLQSLPGVAEVSTVGGMTKQYQVEVNPNALAAYDLTFAQVLEAVRTCNRQAGGRLLDINGAEYMVRGLGYLKGAQDIETVPVGRDKQGTAILVRDVAKVQLGPDVRRGVAELDGQGEVVGGIVTARYGENALNVIARVKQKIEELKPSLPEGVEIVPVYDRSELIGESIKTLTRELLKLAVAVSVVCLVFLWNLPSALVIILTLPVAILLSFVAMRYLGVSSNIMSLGGIAIAIGAMVDASIIMVENAVKRLEEWEKTISPLTHRPLAEGDDSRRQDAKEGIVETQTRAEVILKAAREVGPSLFFTLLVITVGFLPVFALQGQDGRLFSPLAYTKTFSMFFAALLAITLTPVLMVVFLRGKVRGEEQNPLNRFLGSLYAGPARWVLGHRKTVFFSALGLMVVTIFPVTRLGSEYMPPLWEGSLLYMPTTLPGLSVTEAARVLQAQDRVLKSFPEVERVFGKAGRAETPLDPAPFSMVETTVWLKPKAQWRPGMTEEKLKHDMDAALQFAGWANALTMPIINRINMLTSGVKTPIGIKVVGGDLDTIQRVGIQVENALKTLPGTSSVFAERVSGGYYVDIEPRRDQIARFGLMLEDVNEIIETAIGGDTVTTTVEGRGRYPVSVRLAKDFRDDVDKLRRVLVTTPSGTKVQLAQLADIHLALGPSMIRDENGLLAGYVYVDTESADIGGYVKAAKKLLAEKVNLPSGTSLVWSGQYENMVKAAARFRVMIPLALLLVFLLIHLNTKSFTETVIVLLAVPFSLIGAIWLLDLLGYNTSVPVWIGLIALAGLDAETGVVMLLYLNLSFKEFEEKGRMVTKEDLEESVIHGAVKRLRPKLMTVCAAWFGLVPILFSSGVGSDVMKRIAAPMVGGVFTSFVLELLVYPALFMAWKWNTLNPKVEGWFWRLVQKLG